MSTLKSVSILFAMAVAGALLRGQAQAFPFGPGSAQLGAQLDQGSPIVEVRSRGGAVAAGVIGGLIVGGIIASQRHYYSYPPYGYYAPYPPAYAYDPPYPSVGAGVAYCMRRFRSYDPVSMTYLGYDGFRHPCP